MFWKMFKKEYHLDIYHAKNNHSQKKKEHRPECK